MRRTSEPEAMLITSAPQSAEADYLKRRRKYAIMMSIRGLCVVAAALTYTFSIWLAMACVVGGAVLPWCAVLIANDRPAKSRRERDASYRPRMPQVPTERALLPGDDGRTVDG